MECSENCRDLITVVAVVSNPTSGQIDCQQQLMTIILNKIGYITVKSNRNHSKFIGQAESFALRGTNATNVAENLSHTNSSARDLQSITHIFGTNIYSKF